MEDVINLSGPILLLTVVQVHEFVRMQKYVCKSEVRKEKGWGQQVKNKKCENILLFLLFSLEVYKRLKYIVLTARN